MVLDEIVDILQKFQYEHPNIYIGGSVSLILQEAIPYRIPKDIDIISSNRIHIYDIFNITGKPKHKMIRRYYHKDLMFELFNNPNAKFIECKGLKLSPIDEVFEWKLKKQNLNNTKHQNDIKYYETNTSI
jgi:hypothetical protein